MFEFPPPGDPGHPPVDLGLLRTIISGIEVSQSIQYYASSAHLTDTGDQKPDNSVTLVAGKAAWVRVYLHGTSPLSLIVTGELEVRRRLLGFHYVPITTLQPEPPGTAPLNYQVPYEQQRANIGRTLNFVLPADLMCGNLQLIARFKNGTNTVERDVFVNVTLEQTLKVAMVMVGFQGPISAHDVEPPAIPVVPTDKYNPPQFPEMLQTAGFAVKLFPVQSQVEYDFSGVLEWSLPLDDAEPGPGGCSMNWTKLLAAVFALRMADGNPEGWIHYGLVAKEMLLMFGLGCASDGVGTSVAGRRGDMAHELGHACGLDHAPAGIPSGSADSIDPDFPVYEPYPHGSIGEYGINNDTGNIVSPKVARDFMGYSNKKWISPYHHEALVENPWLTPRRICLDDPWWRNEPEIVIPWKPVADPFPVPFKAPFYAYDVSGRVRSEPVAMLSIVGLLDGPALEVLHVRRVRTRPGDRARATDLHAFLLDEKGRTIGQAPVVALPSKSGCGCGDAGRGLCRRIAHALIPGNRPGKSIEIRRGEEVVWSRTAPEKPARVSNFQIAVKKNKLTAQWESRSPSDAPLACMLEWSRTGKRWRPLAAGLSKNRVVLDTRGLPCGRLKVRLAVDDGFHRVRTKAEGVDLPLRAPDIAVLHPENGNVFPEGSTIRLYASVLDPGGGPIDPNDYVWMIGKKEVGRGLECFVHTPKAGKHTLAFTGKGTAGAKSAVRPAHAEVVFRTVKAPSVA